MVDVLIVYEHKVREVETVLAIKRELEKNNIKVKITSITERNKLKYLFQKPKLIVVPSLYATQSFKDQIGFICGNINKVLNLQWEQVYNGESLISKRTPRELAQKAVHVCWGRKSFERLTRANVKFPILVGPPQMDFLKEKFNSYYKNKNDIYHEYNFSKNKKLLLFISSFAYQSVNEDQLEKINKLVDLNAYKFKDITIKTRNIVLDWFKRILETDSDKIIVYRPHPSELDDNELKLMSNKYSNFKIIRDYSVQQWIKISDVVINWYSTSGVEAFFSKVNCIYLRPIELEKEYDYVMYKNVLKIDNYNDFEYYIENPKKINEYYQHHDIYNDINEYYLYNNDYCYEIISKLIIEMLNTNKYDLNEKYVTANEIIIAQIKFLIKMFSDILYEMFPKFTMNTLGKNKRIYNYLRESDYRKKEKLSFKEERAIMKKIEECN